MGSAGFASGDVALWSPQQRRLTGRYNREVLPFLEQKVMF